MSDRLCDYMNVIELESPSDPVVTYRFEWSIIWLYKYDWVEWASDLVVTYRFELSIVWLCECDRVESPSDLVVTYSIWVIDCTTM